MHTILVSSLLLAVVGAPKPSQTKVIRFSGKGRIVSSEVITDRGRTALREEAKRLSSDAQITVVLCSPMGATYLGREITRIMVGEKPLHVSWRAKNVGPKKCPAGMMIEVAAPAVKLSTARAIVLFTKGDVVAKLEDNREIPLYQGSIVPRSSRIVTGQLSRCIVQLPDGSSLQVASMSEINLENFQKKETRASSIFAGEAPAGSGART